MQQQTYVKNDIQTNVSEYLQFSTTQATAITQDSYPQSLASVQHDFLVKMAPVVASNVQQVLLPSVPITAHDQLQSTFSGYAIAQPLGHMANMAPGVKQQMVVPTSSTDSVLPVADTSKTAQQESFIEDHVFKNVQGSSDVFGKQTSLLKPHGEIFPSEISSHCEKLVEESLPSHTFVPGSELSSECTNELNHSPVEKIDVLCAKQTMPDLSNIEGKVSEAVIAVHNSKHNLRSSSRITLETKMDKNPKRKRNIEEGSQKQCETKTKKVKSDKQIEKEKINCKFCKKSFKNQASYQQHEKNLHSGKKQSMNTRNSKHAGKKTKESHGQNPDILTKDASAKPDLKCIYCKKTFNKRFNLQRHEERHLKSLRKKIVPSSKSGDQELPSNEAVDKEPSKKDAESEEKNESSEYVMNYFENSSEVIGNPKITTESNKHTYQCSKCKNMFINEEILQKHECKPISKDHSNNLVSVHSVNNFECSDCKKTFSSAKLLKKHAWVHGPMEDYTCNLCGKVFKEKCNKRKHERFVHSEARNFICSVCGKSFKQADSLKTHVRTHEDEVTSKLQCDECGKYFSGATSLLVHKRSHTGAKPFMCDICGRTFRQTGNMNKHMQIHKKSKDYKCDICGKEYRYQDTWRAHMRRHAIKDGKVNPQESIRTQYGKVYSCEFCGKIISTSSQLKIHLRTHTNERPFQCPLCDKAFKEKGKLSRHHNSVHAGENKKPVQLTTTALQKEAETATLAVLSDLQPVQKFAQGTEAEETLTLAVDDQEENPFVTTSVSNEIIKVYYTQTSSEPVLYFNI